MRTLPGLLERMLASASDQVFLVVEGGAVTGAGFAERARCLALHLSAECGSGDRVVSYLEPGFDQAAGLFAAWLAGTVAVPVNPKLKLAQLEHILRDCEPRVLLTTTSKLAFLQVNASELESMVEGMAVLVVEELAIGAEAETFEPDFAPGPRDTAVLLYTSGSTGLPKAVMQTHHNVVFGAELVAGYLGLTEADRLLGILPLSFDYGLNQLTSAMHVGARVTLQPFFAMADVFAAIERGGITGLAMVPPMWHAFAAWLDAHPETARGCATLRYLTNSGGRLPKFTEDAVRKLLPHVEVFRMYGLTEAFRSTYLRPAELDRRPESIGKALPGVEVDLLDPKTGAPVAKGEVGELVHRGALVAQGYWRRPEDTARVFRDGAVWSGDLARADDDGFLYFVGRRDTQLKVLGHRVSPTELEVVVESVEGVAETSVVGLPDEESGHLLVACVVGAPGLEDMIEQACRRDLPAYLQPHKIVFFDELPKSPNGKRDHQALLELLRDGA